MKRLDILFGDHQFNWVVNPADINEEFLYEILINLPDAFFEALGVAPDFNVMEISIFSSYEESEMILSTMSLNEFIEDKVKDALNDEYNQLGLTIEAVYYQSSSTQNYAAIHISEVRSFFDEESIKVISVFVDNEDIYNDFDEIDKEEFFK